MATNEESAVKLSEEILADAQKESQGIITRARQYAEDILKTATTEAERTRKELRDRAAAEAERRRDLVLATVPIEAGRLRLGRIESLLESVKDDALKHLLAHDGFKYRDVVVNLAALAASRMEGSAFVIRFSKGDHAILGEDLDGDIKKRLGHEVLKVKIVYDPKIAQGSGVIIEDEEGRQIWDMRFPNRLSRMWSELRRQIAIETSFIPRTESGRSNP
jgi:vacuolar-type H+-ATPase subunit E/Vma4